jgi:hypothetical protein
MATPKYGYFTKPEVFIAIGPSEVMPQVEARLSGKIDGNFNGAAIQGNGSANYSSQGSGVVVEAVGPMSAAAPVSLSGLRFTPIASSKGSMIVQMTGGTATTALYNGADASDSLHGATPSKIDNETVKPFGVFGLAGENPNQNDFCAICDSIRAGGVAGEIGSLTEPLLWALVEEMAGRDAAVNGCGDATRDGGCNCEVGTTSCAFS